MTFGYRNAFHVQLNPSQLKNLIMVPPNAGCDPSMGGNLRTLGKVESLRGKIEVLSMKIMCFLVSYKLRLFPISRIESQYVFKQGKT